MNKKAQSAVSSKTVLIILSIMILVAVILLIWKFDILGYVKNLPSFGEVEQQEEVIDDLVSSIKCEEYVGMINANPISDKEKYSNFFSDLNRKFVYFIYNYNDKKDIRRFNFLQKIQGLPVDLQYYNNFYSAEQISEITYNHFLYFHYIETSTSFLGKLLILSPQKYFSLYVPIGSVNPNTKKFQIYDIFNSADFCDGKISANGEQFWDSSGYKYKKDATLFFQMQGLQNACQLLAKLQGSTLYADRLLCQKTYNVENVNKISINEVSSFVKSNINNLAEIREDDSKGPVVQSDYFGCFNTRSRFIDIKLEKNNYFSKSEDVRLFWDFLNSGAVVYNLGSSSNSLFSRENIFSNGEFRDSFKKAFPLLSSDSDFKDILNSKDIFTFVYHLTNKKIKEDTIYFQAQKEQARFSIKRGFFININYYSSSVLSNSFPLSDKDYPIFNDEVFTKKLNDLMGHPNFYSTYSKTKENVVLLNALAPEFFSSANNENGFNPENMVYMLENWEFESSCENFLSLIRNQNYNALINSFNCNFNDKTGSCSFIPETSCFCFIEGEGETSQIGTNCLCPKAYENYLIKVGDGSSIVSYKKGVQRYSENPNLELNGVFSVK